MITAVLGLVRSTSLLLVIGACALAFAACGGDDDEGDGGGATKSEWIQKADSLCAKANKELNAKAAAAFDDPSKPTGGESQAFLKDVVPLQQGLIDDIRELDKPSGGDGEQAEAILDAAQKGTDAIEEASASPDSSLAIVQTEESPYAEANKLSDEFGMKGGTEGCGA
jgi:hypothetical protein